MKADLRQVLEILGVFMLSFFRECIKEYALIVILEACEYIVHGSYLEKGYNYLIEKYILK